jgi:hypothetical protein
MPGTRTATTVNGTPAFRGVSLRYIDAVGLQRSLHDIFPFASATNANVEAYAAANSDISNASLWSVEVTDTYVGVADSSNALDEVVSSVKDHLVFSAFNPADPTDSRAAYLVAPEESLFIPNTRVIDPTNVDIAALLTAYLACLGAGYSITGTTFNQNSQRGRKQKF